MDLSLRERAIAAENVAASERLRLAEELERLRALPNGGGARADRLTSELEERRLAARALATINQLFDACDADGDGYMAVRDLFAAVRGAHVLASSQFMLPTTAECLGSVTCY